MMCKKSLLCGKIELSGVRRGSFTTTTQSLFVTHTLSIFDLLFTLKFNKKELKSINMEAIKLFFLFPKASHWGKVKLCKTKFIS